ncbi:hypothetical protein [Wolbachia endosymbiont (group B) of Camptogramma bilineatum]|uniref:hypothetical protein n=1 Tax=Wolbachia endosymbiont (group B) of Camptogramma bilineatum TaxID=2953991 RepID=UPI002230F398|nr:hypothetical protein [Wolbachia endosymbiont (group B) of Camptogramma bilineatum]
MGDSNEKVDYTELSKCSFSDKIKPKRKVTFFQQVQVKEIPLEGKKKESVNDARKRNRAKKRIGPEGSTRRLHHIFC